MPCPKTESVPFESDYSLYPPADDACLLPLTLQPPVFPLVQHNMVDAEGHQKMLRLATIDLLGNPNTEHTAAFVGVNLPRELGADTSFSQQMHAIAAQSPDVILATYRSAAPVLEAIVGYYEELGKPKPLLDVIDVSKVSWNGHGYTDILSRLQYKYLKETVRLRPVVDKAKVAIVDEYYSQGGALWGAGSIVQRAGASAITGMVGRWYRKLPPTYDHSDEQLLRDTCGEFMREVGHQAARTEVQLKPDTSALDIASQLYEPFKPTILSW